MRVGEFFIHSSFYVVIAQKDSLDASNEIEDNVFNHTEHSACVIMFVLHVVTLLVRAAEKPCG